MPHPHASPEELASLRDRSLPDPRRNQLTEHLVECAECREALARPQANAATRLNDTVPSTRQGGAFDAFVRGDSIGRYLVVELAGQGGMGTVLKAYDPELDRRVAIKLIRVDVVDRELSASLHEQLRREAMAMARLSHPNIVAVFDAGSYGERFYVAMEWVEGQTLRAWQEAAARTPAEVLALYHAAGKGLAAAHAKGLVHRDFKPENVLLGEDGRVRVSDFGLAVAQREHRGEQGNAVGTPDYMSPEQLRGEAVDARSDLFSFCIALYEALYGQLPFAGKHWAERAQSTLAGRLVPPPSNARVAPYLWKVLERGLSADPSARFADMESLLVALEDDPRRRQRRRAIFAGAAVALVVAGSAVTYSVERERTRCARTVDAELAPIWSPSLRQKLQAPRAGGALASSFAHYADELDRFLAALRTNEVATCEEERRHGATVASGLRRRCLNERALELHAAVEDLRESDDDQLRIGPGFSSLLESINACAGANETPATRPEPEELAAPLARLRVMFLDARYDPAMKLAREVESRARATDARRAAAEAAYYQAKIADNQGATPEKLVAGYRHAEQAALAADDLVRVANARLDLAIALATNELPQERLDELRDDAEAAIRGAGDPPPLVARLGVMLGDAALSAGRFQEAVPLLEKAVELEKGRSSGRSSNLPHYQVDLGRAYAAIGDGARASELYAQAVELDHSVFGVDGYDTAVHSSYLADALNREGRGKAALEAARRALDVLRKRNDPHDLSLAFAQLVMGDSLELLGRDAEAAPLYDEAKAAYERASGVEPDELGFLYLSLGRRARAHAQNAEAQALIERAVRLLGEDPIDRHDLALAQFELGTLIDERGNDFAQARALVERAREGLRDDVGEGAARLRTIDGWLAQHPARR